MRLLMIGMNHRTAPIELREKVAVGSEAGAAVLRSLVDRYQGTEAVIVSTCNRTEIYLARPDHAPPESAELRSRFAELGGLGPTQIDEHVIEREQDDAAAHLIGVAAGLDSLALGEPHILGQVRRAYEAADKAGAVGYVLHTVFQQALGGARQVRRDWSGLLDANVSIASLAIDFARQVFETFEDKTVLGVGAGEIGKLTMRTLMREKPKRTVLINRTPGRAEQLARELAIHEGASQRGGGEGGPRPWEHLDQALVEADVLVSATGSAEPIFTAERLKPLVKKRRGRPLFIFDTALPRDVAAKVGSLRNVYLYNLDDLETSAIASTANPHPTHPQTHGPHTELDRAWAQVRGMAGATMSQIQHRDIGRLIRELRTRMQSLGQFEQARTQRKIDALSQPSAPPDPQALSEALDEHTHRLINKILHMPLKRLDQSDPEAPLGFYAAALRELFELDAESQVPRDQPNQTRQSSEEAEGSTHAGPEPDQSNQSAMDGPASTTTPGRGKASLIWSAAILLCLLIGPSACTGPTLPRWVPLTGPSAKVTDMRISEQTDEGAAVEASVVMHNPNNFGLPLEAGTYRMSIADQTVRLRSHPPYALPPKGRQVVTLHGALPTAGKNLQGQPYRLTGSVIYDAPGELRRVLQDFGFPQPRVSFRGEGRLP